MLITLLGTGGPRPDPERSGPATLIEVAGYRLLFDAGRGVATQVVRSGLTLDQIDAVFLTHHHFDHTGGLGDLLMASWNLGRTRPLPVYGPPGTRSLVDTLFAGVYAPDIRFRIREAEHLGSSIRPPRDTIAGIDTGAGMIELDPGPIVDAGWIEHGSTVLGLTDDEWSAVGYRIAGEGRTVAVVGDAVPGRDLDRLADNVDALVISAYLSEDEIVTDGDRFLTDHILAGAPQAARIATDAGARMLVLTHLREKTDAAAQVMGRDTARSFPGEVVIGRDLLSIRL